MPTYKADGECHLGDWSVGGFLKEILFEKYGLEDKSMPTCSECKKWKKTGWAFGKGISLGNCTRAEGPPEVLVWADASCPDFEKRESAAERAARRILLPIKLVAPVWDVKQNEIAKIIQEEMEKGK